MPGIPKTCSASFRAGRIRIWLLIAGALMVCVLAALLAVACQRRLADSNAHACYANLFQIDWCLNTYYLKHSTYPPPPGEPATAPAASWRALAVGAVDAGFTYNVREAWDGPHNRRLIRSGDGSIFWCPRALGTVNRTGKTPYLAVVGAGTVWSEVRLGHIRDPETAVPDKIIVIEVPHSDVYWTEPRDLSMDEAIELYRRENGFKDGRHPHGLHYLTAGGQVHSFDEISSVEEFASLLKAAQ